MRDGPTVRASFIADSALAQHRATRFASRSRDAGGSTTYFRRSLMDHDSLLLTIELVALFALGLLGIWRMHQHRQSIEDAETPTYDMRRDGQRQIPSV